MPGVLSSARSFVQSIYRAIRSEVNNAMFFAQMSSVLLKVMGEQIIMNTKMEIFLCRFLTFIYRNSFFKACSQLN